METVVILEAGTGRHVETRRAPRRSAPMEIVELPGDQFPDLEAAQRSVRPLVATALADILRRMLENGELVVRDGRIVPRG